MKITGLQIHPVSVKRRHKTVVGGGRGMTIPGADAAATESHFAILELETDEGIIGIGEWSDMQKDVDLAALKAGLEARLVGENPFNIEAILSDFRFDRSTACAVDSALYDIVGKALDTPVYNLIGGRVRDGVKVSWVVYVRTADLIAEEMRAVTAQGFTAFKLKVGSNIDHDDTCVRIMRETAGPDAEIKLDASGNWAVDEAIENIRRLSQYDLQGVESPVRGRGAADIARVRNAVDVKIIEHVWERWDYAMDLVKHGSVDIINLFPEGCGGIHRCKKLLALAEAASSELRQHAVVSDEAELRRLPRVVRAQPDGLPFQTRDKHACPDGVRTPEGLPVELLPVLSLGSPVLRLSRHDLRVAPDEEGRERSLRVSA